MLVTEIEDTQPSTVLYAHTEQEQSHWHLFIAWMSSYTPNFHRTHVTKPHLLYPPYLACIPSRSNCCPLLPRLGMIKAPMFSQNQCLYCFADIWSQKEELCLNFNILCLKFHSMGQFFSRVCEFMFLCVHAQITACKKKKNGKKESNRLGECAWLSVCVCVCKVLCLRRQNPYQQEGIK